jgi:hypothetical protein
MSTMDFNIIKEFRDKNPNDWMIKDTLVYFGKYGAEMQSKKVIGVAKNFTIVQRFYQQGKVRQSKTLVALVGTLSLNNHTPAYDGYGRSRTCYV